MYNCGRNNADSRRSISAQIKSKTQEGRIVIVASSRLSRNARSETTCKISPVCVCVKVLLFPIKVYIYSCIRFTSKIKRFAYFETLAKPYHLRKIFANGVKDEIFFFSLTAEHVRLLPSLPCPPSSLPSCDTMTGSYKDN